MPANEILNYIRQSQHALNDSLFNHMEILKQDHSLTAVGGLMLVGFVYGALHAVGPGHGKVIVSSYLLANENSLKRGLLIVALSSLLQSLTAIILVLGFTYVLETTRSGAEQAATYLEAGSFIMIGCMGFWLFGKGIRTLTSALRLHAPAHSDHDEHVHHDGCAHTHVPVIVNSDQSVASVLAMIISIGIRPCSGALLLLFFACAFDLVWPGVMATLLMGVGTALTTGALAVFTVKAKDVTLRFVDQSERGLRFTHAAIRMVGGCVLVVFAAVFLTAILTGDHNTAPAAPPLFKAFH